MKYTYLGRTGMMVSRLVLGTMNFGTRTPEEEAFKIMDRALEAGINVFDTANVYGEDGVLDGLHRGLSEEIIGRWFAQGGGRREKVVLSTKVYMRMQDPLDGPNNIKNLSAYKIRRHLKKSLERLQTDHLELYFMHHVDERATWEELWGAFQPIVDDGTVDYIASSNFGARHICYAQEAAHKRNFLGLTAEQCQYSLVHRLPELELLPACKDLGMGVFCWSPLGEGLLSGHVLDAAPGTRGALLRDKLSEAQIGQLEAYADLCRRIGASESNVALAWLLQNPVVTAPIVGPRTLEQLESALQALALELSQETLKELDQIFPGYDEAPLAYAW